MAGFFRFLFSHSGLVGGGHLSHASHALLVALARGDEERLLLLGVHHSDGVRCKEKNECQKSCDN
jgi:hypothetical protein